MLVCILNCEHAFPFLAALVLLLPDIADPGGGRPDQGEAVNQLVAD